MTTKTETHTSGIWGTGSNPEEEEVIDSDGWVIATMQGPNAKANAHLIASAPELLEACRNALKRLSYGISSDSKSRAVVILESAIASAEGR